MKLLLPLLALLCGLDLPLPPPRSPFAPPEPLVAPPEGEEGGDPRDTPLALFYGEEIEPEQDTIYFVLDRSGSMQSYKTEGAYVDPDGSPARGNRWERAKAEAIRSVRGLADNLRFGILTYDCGVVGWRGGELQESSASARADAEGWIRKQLWATGATGTGPATVSAFAAGARTVVLLTDGEPNCGADGVAGHRSMIASSNPGAVVHVFGIQANGPWRAFCQGVASDSGGRYVDVP